MAIDMTLAESVEEDVSLYKRYLTYTKNKAAKDPKLETAIRKDLLAAENHLECVKQIAHNYDKFVR